MSMWCGRALGSTSWTRRADAWSGARSRTQASLSETNGGGFCRHSRSSKRGGWSSWPPPVGWRPGASLMARCCGGAPIPDAEDATLVQSAVVSADIVYLAQGWGRTPSTCSDDSDIGQPPRVLALRVADG